MATLFLLLIYLAFISLGLPDSLLGAAWPVARLDLGADISTAGVISFIITVGTIISSLASARMTRRFGAGRVTAVSVAATALALLGISLAPSVVWIVLLAVPLGLGAGAVDAALNNYVALHYRPWHMNWLHASWGVGASLGPLILGLFLQQDGNWRGGYRLIGWIQMGVAALLFCSLPLWKRREREEAQLAAQREATESPAAPQQDAAVPSGQARTASSPSVLRLPGVKAALLTFSCYSATEMTLGLWGSSFLVEARGFSEAQAAGSVAVFYAGVTLGRFVSGLLSARLSGRRLIQIGVLLVLLGAGLLLLPGHLALVGLPLAGLGCAPIYPAMIHETPNRFGRQNSQKIIGWQMASAYTGSALLPPLIGLLAGRVGMWTVPLCLLALGALMLLGSERIAAALRGRETAQNE